MTTENTIISSVKTHHELKEFVRFNYELYKDNPYAVPDFLEDTLDTLTRRRTLPSASARLSGSWLGAAAR